MAIEASGVLWSGEPGECAGRDVVLLLHGYGASAADLFSLAPELLDTLGDDAVIAALPAPIALPAPEGTPAALIGRAWFALPVTGGDIALDDTAIAVLRGGAAAAADLVEEWLAGSGAREARSLSLIGFSQGAAVALELLRRDPRRYARTALLSPLLLPYDSAESAAMRFAQPPVFWGRGTHDGVIPARSIEIGQGWLEENSDLDERIYEGVGHTVTPAELDDMLRFLARRG